MATKNDRMFIVLFSVLDKATVCVKQRVGVSVINEISSTLIVKVSYFKIQIVITIFLYYEVRASAKKK